MIEKEIEKCLVDAVKARGGECFKFTSPGCSGVPDRLVLMPGGRIAFVETKAPGKKERPRQRLVQSRLRDMGFTVFSSVDSLERIRDVIEWCATWERGKST